jgi:hypothetical protein
MKSIGFVLALADFILTASLAIAASLKLRAKATPLPARIAVIGKSAHLELLGLPLEWDQWPAEVRRSVPLIRCNQ